MRLLIYFLIFAMSGIAMETFFTAIGDSIKEKSLCLKGRSTLWMFLIYGSVLFIIIFVQNFFGDTSWVIRGLLYAILITLWEFVSGLIIRKVFKVRPWDYGCKKNRCGTAAKKRFHFKGLVCLEYVPLWFIMGLVGEAYYLYLLTII